MRFLFGMAAALVAACAGQPPADTAPRQVKVDGSNIVEAQRAGYTIVNKDGQQLYCSKDPKTGTHLQMTTTCLTKAQWDQLHDAAARSMQSTSSPGRMPGH
jgi:hypothetical protein